MTRSAPLLLLLLGALLFFFALGDHDLQGSTETRVAGIAMAMNLDNDWVVPRLFGEPFLEKPPLSLWLDTAAIRLLGASPLAVRLASAFAGLFSIMLLYGMLRQFGRPRALAFTAALMLATMASYWSNARGVGEDSLLSLGVTMALLGFYYGDRSGQRGAWVLFTLGIAVATLSKGVLGLALTGVAIFVYLVATGLLEKRLQIGRWLRPGLLTAVGLVPLLIWLGVLYQRAGPQAVAEVLWTNSVGRFDGSFTDAGHYESFWYYLLKLPEAFLPWNILVYLGLWHFRKSLAHDRYRLFFAVWLLAGFTMLTLASSKRTVYLMALTPAAAVLAAEYAGVLLGRLKARAQTSNLAARIHARRREVIIAVLTLVVGGYLANASWYAPKVDQDRSFVALVDRIRVLQAEGQHVALYQPSERVAGASTFYLQAHLPLLQTEASLHDYLGAAPGNVALLEAVEPPVAPLAVVTQVSVDGRNYFFVRD
jgi:4-amino-4-deoxy-L-arabinose transferase-like glycosyltransferase